MKEPQTRVDTAYKLLDVELRGPVLFFPPKEEPPDV